MESLCAQLTVAHHGSHTEATAPDITCQHYIVSSTLDLHKASPDKQGLVNKCCPAVGALVNVLCGT